MTPPVEKTVTVPLPPKDAFRVFTEDMGTWWPLDSHSLSAGDGKTARDVTVDPKEGGKITETRHDGTTADWATITDWRPGEHLAFNWYVGRDPSEFTTVAVSFQTVEGGTRVDLRHDGFDNLPDGATVATGYRTGWDGVFCTRFGGACQKRAA